MAHYVLDKIALASFLLVAVGARAQSSGEDKIAPAICAQNWNASELIGQKVCTMRLEEVGTVKNLVMSPDGKIIYAALSFEGFTKNGDKLYAVPMEAIYLTWKDGKVKNARVDVTEDKVKQLTAFDKNHEPLFADAGFAREHSTSERR